MNSSTGLRSALRRGMLAITLLGLGLTSACAARVQAPPALAALPENASGFTRAEGPRAFTFPSDHGPHDDFQTEWWYFTGNLDAPDGRHFGYELTFFRRALLPPGERTPRPSPWAAEQVYMAHFALSDVAAKDFHYYQRLERGAEGLAGASGDPTFSVWLDDWRVAQAPDGTYHLHAAQEGLALELTLSDAKGPILQGDGGYSRKGPDPGNASYYVSLTHLVTTGSVQVGEATYAVAGLSWMDHEFSTSALSDGQVGWDWFALHLDDGSELMAFTLRRADGSRDPYSSGTLIAPDGSTRALAAEDFQIAVEGTWRSPHSGAVYPAAWTLSVPSAGLTLRVTPYLADQELRVAFTYWEGAVRVSGERNGQPLAGSGYVELTGYAGSMQGQF